MPEAGPSPDCESEQQRHQVDELVNQAERLYAQARAALPADAHAQELLNWAEKLYCDALFVLGPTHERTPDVAAGLLEVMRAQGVAPMDDTLDSARSFIAGQPRNLLLRRAFVEEHEEALREVLSCYELDNDEEEQDDEVIAYKLRPPLPPAPLPPCPSPPPPRGTTSQPIVP